MKKFLSTLLLSSLVSIPLLAGLTDGEEVIVQGVPVEKASSGQSPQEKELLRYFSQLSAGNKEKIVRQVKLKVWRKKAAENSETLLRLADPNGGL